MDLLPGWRMTQVALITGAAGGLGQALVSEFLEQGFSVVAGHHSLSVHEPGDNLLSVALDVTNREHISAVAKQVLDRWQRIDVLINNAGLAADDLVTRMDDADWDAVLEVNLKGAFLCCQAVVRPMLKQRAGHIINIGSFSGRAGVAGQANYAAAKSGLIGLTQALAKEVGSRDICVNAVLPGVLATRMTEKLAAEAMAAFREANALGRINSVEEVARFVCFLATMRNVSGQVFQLDSRIAPWT
jgi:3-oxoacyl-[acyl-carrier protein] reductase